MCKSLNVAVNKCINYRFIHLDRLNYKMRKHVDKQLNELLTAGVITEDDGSAFASPIFMVKKRSGDWRFSVDMRHLNKICLPLFHELPVFENVLDVIIRNKAKIITTMDLRQAYHQISLTEESSHKTTFITHHRGAYRYLRLPQGYAQSPYFMQVALNKLFRDQIGTYLFISMTSSVLATHPLNTLNICKQYLRSLEKRI